MKPRKIVDPATWFERTALYHGFDPDDDRTAAELRQGAQRVVDDARLALDVATARFDLVLLRITQSRLREQGQLELEA